jgi:hypothetical protein
MRISKEAAALVDQFFDVVMILITTAFYLGLFLRMVRGGGRRDGSIEADALHFGLLSFFLLGVGSRLYRPAPLR